MHHYHAVVWIDHKEARIFHYGLEGTDALTIHPDRPVRHLHHKAGERGSGRPEEDQHYYHAVAEALSGAGEILVVGPARAKLELIRHIHRHDQALEPRIVGVETVDHPSDRQVLAYARSYFSAEDRLRLRQG